MTAARFSLPAVAAALLCLGGAAAGAADRPPNVVVIFTDDHGYADLGVQGRADDLKTPHLDALAAGGVRFTDGYVTAPQCVPSRAGLISGRDQNRFGLESNPQTRDAAVMRRFADLRTVPERLQAAGYATGMAGKWHLGPDEEIGTHGFDEFLHKNSARPGVWNANLAGKTFPPRPQTSGYHLEVIADFACAFVDRHHDEPFFFYLAPRAPHVPLDPPARLLERFPGEMPERRRKALAMLSAVDDGVGRLTATLREHGLEENTLIFVLGDNGAPLKKHMIDAPGGGPGWDGSLNTPLNGEKGMLTEGGIRVPFLASWPGTLPAGATYSQPVASLDVVATAAALAGADGDGLDGVNLLPHLTGETDAAPHDRLFWRWLDHLAVREGRWKLLRAAGRQYLFDLDADLEERRDLSAAHPEVVARLLSAAEGWAEGLTPPGVPPLSAEGVRGESRLFVDWYLDGKPDPREPGAVPPPPVRPAGAAGTR